jgi:ribosomal-protein-alanine N-acetyltransferase
MKNKFPFHELSTKNFILRRLTLNDAESIYKIRSDLSIAKYLDRPICRSIHEAEEFINKINDGVEKDGVFYWTIREKGKEEIAGTICLWKIAYEKGNAEIGFELLPEHQGKGIMKEVVPGVINFAFNILGLKTIEGEVAKENERR